MIGGQQRPTIRHPVFRSVLKYVTLLGTQTAQSLEAIEIGIKGDFSESDDDFRMGQSLELSLQIWRTIGQLLRERLVVRRGAARGGSDVEVSEQQAVVAVSGAGLVGKSSFVKNGVHEFAGSVACKWATGAVGTVRSWGQT